MINDMLDGHGCLAKSAPDEPVFVLCGRDITAAGYVREWAAEAAERLGILHPKVIDAQRIALEMEAWPNRKYPD